MKKAGQSLLGSARDFVPDTDAITFQSLLYGCERGFTYDGFMLAVVNLFVVADLAEIDAVGQKAMQTVFAESYSADSLAGLGGPPLGSPAASIDLFDRWHQPVLFEYRSKIWRTRAASSSLTTSFFVSRSRS